MTCALVVELLPFIRLQRGNVLHTGHFEHQAYGAKLHNITVLEHLGLEGNECQLTQARFVAALQVFNVEEGFRVANTRMLAGHGHLRIKGSKINVRPDATLGVHSPDDHLRFDNCKLLLRPIFLVAETSIYALFGRIGSSFPGTAGRLGRGLFCGRGRASPLVKERAASGTFSRASSRAEAEAKRSAGFFASAWSTIVWSSAGVSCLNCNMRGAGAVPCSTPVSAGLRPTKGRRPVTSSNMSSPNW